MTPRPRAAALGPLLAALVCSAGTAQGAPGPVRARPGAPVTALATRALPPQGASGAVGTSGWVAETPEGMLDALAARVSAPAASEGERLAALLVMTTLEHQAPYGHARRSYEALAKSPLVPATLRGEAALRAFALRPATAATASVAAARGLGVATEWTVVGPFRDTGGGLQRREGPELTADGFRNDASYAWGTVDVRPRVVPPVLAGAFGLPLDLLVHPRPESCSYLGAAVEIAKPGPVEIAVASSGQVRASFGGAPLGASEEVHGDAMADRLSARIDAPAGTYPLVLKVCTGALGDAGRVRVRFTGESGEPLPLVTHPLGAGRSASPLPARQVMPLATPLGRVLASNASTPDGLLAAAVARTVGGADDDRSPRAPGILEALTRAPRLGVDVLALAGSIAPFGAQRSGWLEQAWSRAAEGPRGVRAFVERRLVESRQHAGLGDWALLTARSAGLARAADAEGVRLYASARSALGSEALRIASVDALAALQKKMGEATPTAVLVDLATAVTSFSVERGLAAREQLARRGYPDAAYVAALGAKGRAAVTRAAEAAFDEGAVESCDEGLSMAASSARAGDGPGATRLYRRLTGLCPNRPEAFTGLAHALSAAGGAGPDMVAALRRARDLAPGDPRVRGELALRSPEKGGGGREDERYLVPSSAVLARRRGVPEGTPDVADRQVYWLRAVVMHDDKRVSQLMHYGREIVIAPRTQDELYEPLPIEGDTAELLRARVHRKDGTVDFPAEEHNEGARAYIRWPDLAPGDVVEVALRSWTSRPVGGRGDAPFSFFDYAGSTTTHPLLYNEVIVERAPGASLFVDVLGGAPDKREEREERGRHVTRLVWNHPPSVPDEPLAPKLAETVPMIVGSTYRTWDDFRAWYKEAIRGFTEPDAEVRRLAAELTRGKATSREKMEALFNFVADDIRYVNYTSGEWWLPNRPQQVLARREGDCDDKALLLITLLKTVGIEAEEVMVQTRQTGQPSLLQARNIAVPLFDHGIAFLPGPNGGTWLDATSPQSRLGPLPSMDAGGMALRLEGRGPPQRIPAASPAEHGSDVRWTVELDATGAAKLAGEETHSGDSAFWLRGNLTEEGARSQYVEQSLLGGWLPTVEVDGAIDFRGDLPKGQAWVRYGARSAGFARREEGELVVGLAPSRSLTSSLAPLARRALPVVLPSYLAPSHSLRTVRLVAPAGYTWADPPAPSEATSAFGSGRLEVKRDGPRGMVVTRAVMFGVAEVPVDQYGAFRAWLGKVDALMNRQLRLVPARGGS